MENMNEGLRKRRLQPSTMSIVEEFRQRQEKFGALFKPLRRPDLHRL